MDREIIELISVRVSNLRKFINSNDVYMNEYKKVENSIKDLELSNKLKEYREVCAIMTFAINVACKVSEESIKNRLSINKKNKIVINNDVMLIIQKCLSNKVVFDDINKALFNILKLNETTANEEDFITSILDMIDESAILLNYTLVDSANIKAYKDKVDILCKQLIAVSTFCKDSKPYGVMYSDGKFRYVAHTDKGVECKAHYYYIGNEVVPTKLALRPLYEQKIYKLFSDDIKPLGDDEFLFKYDDKDNFVSNIEVLDAISSTGNKTVYFPLFTVSLIYRVKMIFSDGKWKLSGNTLLVDDYAKWLKEFIENKLLQFLIYLEKYSGDNRYKVNTIWELVIRSLKSYVVLCAFENEAKVSFLYNTAENNKETLINHLTSIKSNILGDKFAYMFGNSNRLEEVYAEILKSTTDTQNYYGMVCVTTADFSGYYGLTSFAYKTYLEYLDSGQELNFKNLFLGKNSADSLLLMNTLESEYSKSLYITAGSGGGKGVLTLNILCGLLALGCPIVYADNKPDMAAMLWRMEKIINEANGQTDFIDDSKTTLNPNYKRVLAIDGFEQETKYLHIGDTNNVLGYNSTRVHWAYQSMKDKSGCDFGNNYQYIAGFTAMAKLTQLYLILVFCMQKGFDIDTNIKMNKDAKFILVLDELTKYIKTNLDKVIDQCGVKFKKPSDTSGQLKFAKDDAEINSSLKSIIGLCNDVYTAYSSAITAWLRDSNKHFIIMISQALDMNVDCNAGLQFDSANVPYSFLGRMLQQSWFKIYGLNGNIKQEGRATGFSPITLMAVNGTPACQAADEVNKSGVEMHGDTRESETKMISRKFVFTNSKTNENPTAFAPLFTLNDNDLLIANRDYKDKVYSGGTVDINDEFIEKVADNPNTGKSFTAGFLRIKGSAGENVQELIKNELLEKDNDNNWVLNEKIGFWGLLRLLFSRIHNIAEKEVDNNILNQLHIGYELYWSVLNQIGLVNKMGYQCVEEYLYDLRPESFISSEEVKDYFANKKSGTNNNYSEVQEISDPINLFYCQTCGHSDTLPVLIPCPMCGGNPNENGETWTCDNGHKVSINVDKCPQCGALKDISSTSDEETDDGVPETYDDESDNESDDGFGETGGTGETDGFGGTDESSDDTESDGTESEPIIFNTGEDEVIKKCKTCGYENGSGVGNPCRHCGGDPNVRGNTWICSSCHSRMSDRIRKCLVCGIDIDSSIIPEPDKSDITVPPPTSQPSPFSHTEASTYNDTPDNSYTEPYESDFVFKDDGKFHLFGDNAMMKQTSANLLSIIEEVVGNLSRVNNISIENGGHIIVNGIHINPSLTDEQIQQLPLDLRYKVSNGQWFELFHGKDLAKFKNLRQLIIADMSMADKVCLDTGKADVFKLRAWLERKTALNSLIVAGVEVREEEREYMEDASRGSNFVNGVHGAFAGIKGVGGALLGACRTVRNSRIWNSPVGHFVKGVASVAGIAVALPFLSGLIAGLGFFGTLNLAIACAGGAYNVVRHKKKSSSGSSGFGGNSFGGKSGSGGFDSSGGFSGSSGGNRGKGKK